MKGIIFDIKHFAVHDGPGIRTTVFFKGCPLRCQWCHNPESLQAKSQLGYIKHKCTHCGRCATVCPTGAQSLTDEHMHKFDRSKCITCGKCVSKCYSGALALYGKTATVTEIVNEVLEDKDFYESSNGGVTLSGGECLVQSDFCTELLKECKNVGLHTAVDTCGFVSKDVLDKVMPYTDLFLYDVKAFNEAVHIKCTGQSNVLILDNLKYLSEKGKEIEIRIPYVPDFNAGEIAAIGEFLRDMKGIVGVRILPYHNYAITKYKSLEMEDSSPENVPKAEELKAAADLLTSYGIKVLA